MLPLVSVIMPVYNAENYLREAIESILNQTYTNFEFIIIDDNSTDNSLKIIQSYNDPRIKLLQNNTNLGVTKTLNIGLKNARGKYIARMDADDISLPTRLEKQVDFLLKNQDYCLIGSYYQLIEDKYIVKLPVSDESIRANMIFHNPFCHPSVMFDNELLRIENIFYNEQLKFAQDEDLWYRLSKFGKLYNLPEVLLYYRTCGERISVINRNQQQKISLDLKLKKITDFLDTSFLMNVEYYLKLISDNDILSEKKDIIHIKRLIIMILNHNKKIKKVSNKYLKINLVNLFLHYLEKRNDITLIELIKLILFFMKIRRIPVKFLLEKLKK